MSKTAVVAMSALFLVGTLVGCSAAETELQASETDTGVTGSSEASSGTDPEKQIEDNLNLVCMDVWAATNSAGGSAWSESWGRVALGFRDLAILESEYSSLYEDAVLVQADARDDLSGIQALARILEACPFEE